MAPVRGGLRCASCAKTVYDLRLATEHTARGLSLVHGRDGFCARLTVDETGFAILSPGRAVDAGGRASALLATVAALSVAACGHAEPPRVFVVAPRSEIGVGSSIDAGDAASADVTVTCASADAGPAQNMVVVVNGGVGSIREYVHFASGSSTVPADASTLLDAVADTLRAHPELKSLIVEGHADAAESNPQARSEERAKKVVVALTQRGIDASRLVPKGYAAANPIAPNTTAAGREKNRRVEFRIDPSSP